MQLVDVNTERLRTRADRNRKEALERAEAEYRQAIEAIRWLEANAILPLSEGNEGMQVSISDLSAMSEAPNNNGLAVVNEDRTNTRVAHSVADERGASTAHYEPPVEMPNNRLSPRPSKMDMVRQAAILLPHEFSTQELRREARRLYPKTEFTNKSVSSIAYQLRQNGELVRVRKPGGSDPDVYSLPQKGHTAG